MTSADQTEPEREQDQEQLPSHPQPLGAKVRRTSLMHRIPLWLILAGIAGFIFYLFEQDAVFPTASIDLKLSRGQIQNVAATWSDKLGFSSAGSLKSTVFSFDNNAKTFLEFELGIAKANQLMQSELPIWYWRSRFCKELKDEEMRVYISPAGVLNGFAFEVSNDRAFPSLTQAESQKLAENFVSNEVKMSLHDYRLVKATETAHKKRTDHMFTWERKRADLHDATLRVDVTVSGNQVTYFNQYLKIPESWEVRYKTMRSYNNMLWQIANVFYILLWMAMLCLFIRAVSTHTIRWKFALGMTSVLTVGCALAILNTFDSIYDNYPTSLAVSQFITNLVTSWVVVTIAFFVATVGFVGATEWFYRKSYPEKMAVENYFHIAGLATKQMSRGLLAGILLFGAGLGWQMFYYLAGKQLNFYSPLQVSNYETLSSVVPFYVAITVGVFASFTEEALYRVFALRLVGRFVRNFWLANLLQSAAWAFMHSTYAQQPCYARGVELTVSGLIDGWAIRRFGLVAVIVEHYLFDAFLDADVLVRSSVWPLKLSGLIPTVPLLILALVSFLLARRSKAVDSDMQLSNEALDIVSPPLVPPSESELVEEFEYKPIAASTRRNAVLVGLLALAISIYCWYNPRDAGHSFRLAIDRSDAVRLAKDVLKRHHLVANDYLDCAWTNSDTDNYINASKYAVKEVGKAKANQLVELCADGFVWVVRFFKPENRTEYSVTFDGQGKESGFTATVPEEAPGAKLSEAKARELVDSQLDMLRGRLPRPKFESSAEEERPNRDDYHLTYVWPELRTGDADFKVTEDVIGDVLSGPSKAWELPDAWRFEEQKVSRRRQIAGVLKQVLSAIVALAALWAAVGVVRSVKLHWRIPALIAMAAAVGKLADILNSLIIQMGFYSTSQPIVSFVIERSMNSAGELIGPFGFALVASALAFACRKLLLPKLSLRHYLKVAFFPEAKDRQIQRQIWLDAIICGYSLAFIEFAAANLSVSAKFMLTPEISIDSLSRLVTNSNVYSGFLLSLVSRITSGCSNLISLTLCVALYAKYFKTPARFFIFLAIACLILNLDQRYWQVVLIETVKSFFVGAAVWYFVAKIAKSNLLTYVMVGFAVNPLSDGLAYLDHGTGRFLFDGIVLTIVPFLPIIYVLYLYSARRAIPSSA